MRGLKVAAVALSVVIAATGCGVKEEEVKIDNNGTDVIATDNVLLTEVPGTDQIPDNQAWDMYDNIGEIIEISGDDIVILTGDIAQSYKLKSENITQVFLGQYVGVVELEDGIFKAEPFIIKDFSVRFTSMGQMIETKSGIITDIKSIDEAVEITIDIGGQSYTSQYSGDLVLVVGNTYDFDLINMGESSYISEIYDPEAVIDMTIKGFNRNENGNLIVSASDQNGGEYVLSLENIVTNFNYTDLKAGDIIKVYPASVIESMPMQVQANKIIK